MANQFDGVDIDGRRRQPVADHDHNLARAAALLFQRAPRIRIEHASEIGTAQIVAPVARLAGNLADLQAEAGQSGNQMRRIESGVNGIARTRVVEREGKQRVGRHARAGAAEPDARRRQLPQGFERAGRRRRRFHGLLLGRDRGLAQPDRIIRRVLLTDRRGTREHDQMMCDHAPGRSAPRYRRDAAAPARTSRTLFL